MDLKDLANEESGTSAGARPTAPWRVVPSRLLEEEILVVHEKKHLKEAEHAHPGLVVYFPPEIEELRRHSHAPDFAQFLRTVHAVKKHVGGWIVPSNRPGGYRSYKTPRRDGAPDRRERGEDPPRG